MNEADRLIATGHPLEDSGDFEAAIACYRKAIEAAPDYPRAYMNVGNALRRLERWNEAIDAYRKAVAVAPNFGPARFNLGSLLFDRGDLDGAQAELEEASRLAADMYEAPIVLADVLEVREKVR